MAKGSKKYASPLSSTVDVEGSAASAGAAMAITAAVAAAVGAAVGAAIGALVCAMVGAGVGARLGVTVAVGPTLAVGTGASVRSRWAPAAHVDRLIESLINVTSPFRASTRPFTVTPLFTVIEVSARMVPAKIELDPRVAELVTCQNTLQGCAPLMKLTVLEEAVTRSDVAWKIHTELGSFWPSRVSVPVSPSVAPPAL